MSIFVKAAISLTLVFAFVKNVDSQTPKQDSCPSRPDEEQPCQFYMMDKPLLHDSTHARQCEYDVFMSLCAISDPGMDYVDRLWPFMCTGVNYNLGCRYCYAYCLAEDTVKFQDGEFPELKTMLAWYDAFTMGGKFALCDMNTTTVQSIVADPCIEKSQDVLKTCMANLQNTFYDGFQTSTPANCSEMNTRIDCFLSELVVSDCPSEVQNVFMQYFQGVVSMSPCVGNIAAVPGGTAGLLSSKLILALTVSLITIINYL